MSEILSPEAEAALLASGKYIKLDSEEEIRAEGHGLVPSSKTVQEAIAYMKRVGNFGDIPNVMRQVQAQFNETNINVMPAEDFLRGDFLTIETIRKAVAGMLFMPWIARREAPLSNNEVRYLRFVNTDVDDPLRVDPQEMSELGEFSTVKATNPIERRAQYIKIGYQLVFSQEVMNETTTAFDYVGNQIDRAAAWFTRSINEKAGNVLTGDFSTVQTGDDAVFTQEAAETWGSTTGDPDPIGDIRDLVLTMRTEDNYFTEPTDLFVTPENYRELTDFLDSAQQVWALDPFTERRTLTIDSIRIHPVRPNSGLTDNFGIMLRNPEESRPLIMFEKTLPDFPMMMDMIQTHEFMANNNHSRVVQMFKKFAVIRPNPKDVGLLHGL